MAQVVHVFEVFIVTTLVAGHGDGLGIFLDGGVHHLLYAAVVTEVDDFHAGGLDDAPHDVDGGIVSVEQAGGRYDPHLILWFVGFGCRVSREIPGFLPGCAGCFRTHGVLDLKNA